MHLAVEMKRKKLYIDLENYIIWVVWLKWDCLDFCASLVMNHFFYTQIFQRGIIYIFNSIVVLCLWSTREVGRRITQQQQQKILIYKRGILQRATDDCIKISEILPEKVIIIHKKEIKHIMEKHFSVKWADNPHHYWDLVYFIS